MALVNQASCDRVAFHDLEFARPQWRTCVIQSSSRSSIQILSFATEQNYICNKRWYRNTIKQLYFVYFKVLPLPSNSRKWWKMKLMVWLRECGAGVTETGHLSRNKRKAWYATCVVYTRFMYPNRLLLKKNIRRQNCNKVALVPSYMPKQSTNSSTSTRPQN